VYGTRVLYFKKLIVIILCANLNIVSFTVLVQYSTTLELKATSTRVLYKSLVPRSGSEIVVTSPFGHL
jgi:positive regulator of sigma E activity